MKRKWDEGRGRALVCWGWMMQIAFVKKSPPPVNFLPTKRPTWLWCEIVCPTYSNHIVTHGRIAPEGHTMWGGLKEFQDEELKNVQLQTQNCTYLSWMVYGASGIYVCTTTEVGIGKTSNHWKNAKGRTGDPLLMNSVSASASRWLLLWSWWGALKSLARRDTSDDITAGEDGAKSFHFPDGPLSLPHSATETTEGIFTAIMSCYKFASKNKATVFSKKTKSHPPGILI